MATTPASSNTARASMPAPAAATSAAAAKASDGAFAPQAATTWTAPSSEPPPMILPDWVHSIMARLRGGALNTAEARAGRVYNFARAHPLATPSPVELEALKREHAAALAANPRLPAFDPPSARLRALGLGEDELTRFRLIGVHMWLLSAVMQAAVAGPVTLQAFCNVRPTPVDDPAAAAEEKDIGRDRLSRSQRRQLSQVFDLYWHEMMPLLQNLRGELRLSSALKGVQESWYYSFLSLDLAWAEARSQAPLAVEGAPRSTPVTKLAAAVSSLPPGSATGMEALVATLWRIFWLSDPRARKRDVYVLATYFVLQARHLSQFSVDQLWNCEQGVVTWQLANALVSENARGDDMISSVLRVPRSQWANSDFSAWQVPILQQEGGITFKGN